MPSHKFTAIILKRTNLGEADRIVTAFSKELGKIKFVAKGVRRTKSKLAGSIELFCESNLIISDGKSLDILTNAEIKNNYLGLTPDLEKLKLSSFIAEVANKLTIDNTPNEALFGLIDRVLSQITNADTNFLKIYFLTNFFEISGVNPELNLCVRCGEKPQGKVFFSNEAGGILDENCALYHEDAVVVEQNTIKILRLSMSTKITDYIRLKASTTVISETSNLLNNYLNYTFDKTFKSDLI